jgi:uncharacterized DUF497 family protein/uncharacterized protein (DUF4415 family)
MDKRKRLSNLEKHRVDFRDAYQVWGCPMIILEDKRWVYNEKRWTALGLLNKRVMNVVYTKRLFNMIRIISFRKGNQREVKQYENSKKNDKPKYVRYTVEELKRMPSLTDYAALNKMTDADIDDSESPFDEELWKNAKLVDPGVKKAISLRVDRDVLAWFKNHKGCRYQRLINQVLRQYMDAHRK